VGVDNLAVGTGYDSAAKAAIGQATDFSPGQTVYIVFSTHSTTAAAVARISLLRTGNLEDVSLPIAVTRGDHIYFKTVMLGPAGTVTIKVSYNGATEQTMQIKVG